MSNHVVCQVSSYVARIVRSNGLQQRNSVGRNQEPKNAPPMSNKINVKFTTFLGYDFSLPNIVLVFLQFIYEKSTMSLAKAATTLQKKKNTISKGKLKKTIKNVLCRPDPVFWPEITEEEGKRLESALKKHKVVIPQFKKPHWKDLKNIPKEQRPKPPKLKKVDGLLLGIRECSEAVHNGECSAIIIEAKINPRLIVQPILEMCATKDIPLLCMSDLRKVSAINFGLPTSCLGIKCHSLLDVRKEIVDMAKNHPKPKQTNQLKKTNDSIVEKVEVEENVDTVEVAKVSDVPAFKMLYRTNKNSRVFVPTAPGNVLKPTRNFICQDFIEFSDKPDLKKSKEFMRMLVKRFSNNPDRVKKK